MGITIKLNGKDTALENDATIGTLLDKRKMARELATVQLNDALVVREKFDQTTLNADDELEILFQMGGG